PVQLLHRFLSNPPAPTDLSPLSLHDALPISSSASSISLVNRPLPPTSASGRSRIASPVVRITLISMRSGATACAAASCARTMPRSEEHTSELQSLTNLVCRLLLDKKKKMQTY